jgi:hypothetical protein
VKVNITPLQEAEVLRYKGVVEEKQYVYPVAQVLLEKGSLAHIEISPSPGVSRLPLGRQ